MRGGKRKGAGRKPAPYKTTTISVRVREEWKEPVKEAITNTINNLKSQTMTNTEVGITKIQVEMLEKLYRFSQKNKSPNSRVILDNFIINVNKAFNELVAVMDADAKSVAK